jgi:hypothetical protein
MSSAEHQDSIHSDPASDTEPQPELTEKKTSQFRNPKVAEKDETSLRTIALRDLAAVSVLLSIFGGADSWARTTDLALAHFVVVVIGLLGGAAAAAMGHEWGHFAVARLGGGHAPTKRVKDFPQIFDFDYRNNSPKSFLWMSIGGSLGNWGMALFFALALPLGSLGPDALVAGAVGFSVFTAFVEFPVIKNARAGMNGFAALMQIPKDFSTRYLPQSFTAAFLTFIIL